VKGKAETAAWQQIFQVLISHHDSLRINYDSKTHQLFYNDALVWEPFSIREYDISALPVSIQREKITTIGTAVKSSFTITSGFLIKVCIFRLAEGKQLLLMTAHHLVIDGVSIRILLEDLYSLLELYRSNQPLQLGIKSASLQQWAQQVQKDYCQPPAAGEVAEWECLSSVTLEKVAAHFYDGNHATHTENQELRAEIDHDTTAYLLGNANKVYNTSTAELLLITMALAISDVSGSGEVLLELEGHGRNLTFSEDINIYRTIGWFTQFTIRLLSIPAAGLDTRIKAIKDQLRNPSLDTPRYAVLRDVLQLISTNPTAVRFNYLGDFSNTASNDFFELCHYGAGPDVSSMNSLNCLFELNCYVLNGCLQLQVSYPVGRINETVMKAFIAKFRHHLTEILDFIQAKKTNEFSPSDFALVDISQSELDALFNQND
jgi:non-ribosomal peptide synthase protein (TIGR01720 family)